MSVTVPQTLEELLQCVVTELGVSTGTLIHDQIQNIMNLSTFDVTNLTNLITTIQNLLDADPGTPGFQTGSNIVTTLASLSDRVSALENIDADARLTVLETAKTALEARIADEEARAQAAEQNLQNLIDGLNSQLVTLTAQIEALQNTSPNECDCAALSAQIAALQAEITNLQATDAAQAIQIAALQATDATIAGQIAALQTAIDTATATANQALSAANSANASVATLSTVVSALDAREAQNAAVATSAIALINQRLGDWTNTCENLVAAFTVAQSNAANGYN